MKSNKGRFKCPHEAQAVWNVFKKHAANRWFVEQFEIGSEHGVLALDYFANDLHEARLIHGSIYDEYWRIEDKDVAHAEYLSGVFDVNFFSPDEPCKYGDDPCTFNEFLFFSPNTKIRGTIFY
jgi:hypothetical protein